MRVSVVFAVGINDQEILVFNLDAAAISVVDFQRAGFGRHLPHEFRPFGADVERSHVTLVCHDGGQQRRLVARSSAGVDHSGAGTWLQHEGWQTRRLILKRECQVLTG